MEEVLELYPLISLQIGDAQSYLSRAYLFFALSSYKFLILVDNNSWRMNNNHSTTMHLRELFATKYRTSPFKNTRVLARRMSARYKNTSLSSNDERKKLYRWASTVNSRRWRATRFFSLMDLHVALHGFIVFEVSWNDIRGINYFNILQMDASMAFEVKFMRKWDFHSIQQATTCIGSWFSGTSMEIQALWKCLRVLDNRSPLITPTDILSFQLSKEVFPEERDQANSLSDKEQFFNVRKCTNQTDGVCCNLEPTEEELRMVEPKRLKINLPEHIEIESMEYKDTLLKFYFNDKDLPFIFKNIITTDLRLLTLLESGLPSWVVFLQSYPLFCKVYRPWMRPLVRTLYISISLVTCMIGFYDLYKNVPLMTAMVSHICGPLFTWIEDWDMVSRIQYIGTMLFLQNFEKALKFSLKIGRLMKLALFLLAKPFMEPLQDLMEFTSPLWVFLGEASSEIYRLVSFASFFICNFFYYFFRALFLPFMFLYKYLVATVTMIRPVIMYIWALFQIPIKACSALGNHAGRICSNLCRIVQGMLKTITSRISLLTRLTTPLSRAKPRSTDSSMWNTLGKELLSKVIHSLRSIMLGLVACFDAVVRHRHSASNHMREYIRRLSDRLSARLEGPQHPFPLESPHKESSKNLEHVD